MHRPTLHTRRIELRPMTGEHLELLAGLDADADVMRHILGRARTREEVLEFWGPICAETQADATQLGWWVGFAREVAAGSMDTAYGGALDAAGFLGWWDLSPALPVDVRGPAPDRAELGYRLARRHWRTGLATEGAWALLTHGFDTVGLDVVWAETMAVNGGEPWCDAAARYAARTRRGVRMGEPAARGRAR